MKYKTHYTKRSSRIVEKLVYMLLDHNKGIMVTHFDDRLPMGSEPWTFVWGQVLVEQEWGHYTVEYKKRRNNDKRN